MKNEFLPYDRALKLKELGFDEPCIATHGYLELYINTDDGHLKAPLFQQAFRWFRENYSLYSLIGIHPNTKEWYSSYQNLNWSGKETLDFIKTEDRRIRFKTYEEAELACLDKLIEIVESKNKTK